MDNLIIHNYPLRPSAQLVVQISSKSPAFCNRDEGIRAASEGMETTRPDLPEDLVREILFRLPVKSLVRFKRVCKLWYNLIRSPNFINEHYKTTSQKKKVSIFYCYLYDSLVTFRFFDVPVKLAIPPLSDPQLVGCDNGLVCLAVSPNTHNKFLLWNPATTQSRIIPITGLRFITDFIQFPKYYSGLCFDSVANIHKIISIRFSVRADLTVPKGMVYVVAYVYTLNDNTWREYDLFAPCNGGIMSLVKHVMKFMCWMVSGDNDRDKYILCLDMVDVMFKVIELPSADHIHCRTELVDYKGSIAMFVGENFAFDLWVLNDCGGASQSWCKHLTFRPNLNNVQRPLGFLTKGDVDFVILCTSDDQCLLWDEDSGKTKNFILGKFSDVPSFIYSESFASVYQSSRVCSC